MTTAKKKPAKTTAKKTTTPKDTTAKKRSTKSTTATKAAPAAEKVTVTMAPEAPETATVAVEATATVPAATEAPAAEATAEKPVLTIGMLQKRLYERGFYFGHWDGHYGQLTKEAVGHFQWKNGLYPDGEPTPETLKALGF